MEFKEINFPTKLINSSYSCHLCSAVFDKFAPFQKHTLGKHNSIPRAICKLCTVQCGNRKRILEHKRFHCPDEVAFECKECKRSYILKRAYEAHLKERHGPNSKKFECTKCPKSKVFLTLADLKHHQKIHLPPELKQFYYCDLCHVIDDPPFLSKHFPKISLNFQEGKKFSTKCSLKTHMTSIHLQIKPVFTCEFCGKLCPTQGALKDHQFTHKPSEFPLNLNLPLPRFCLKIILLFRIPRMQSLLEKVQN